MRYKIIDIEPISRMIFIAIPRIERESNRWSGLVRRRKL
jgi:hypothetical protein